MECKYVFVDTGNVCNRGDLALFKNLKGQWFEASFYDYIEDKKVFVCDLSDGSMILSNEIKEIPKKTDKSVYHIAYYTDKSEFYSNGLDVEALNMFEALNYFREKFVGIEPMYIVKKNK